MSNVPLYNSESGINFIIRNVEERTKRKLTPAQMDYVARYVKSIAPITVEGFPPKEIYSQIIGNLIKGFNESKKPSISQMEVMDVLRRDIGTTGEDGAVKITSLDSESATGRSGSIPMSVSKLMNENTTDGIQKYFNPKARERKAYIVLDSKNRTVSDSVIQFKWNVVSNITPGNGSVNLLGAVRDIVAIKCNQVRIPYVRSADNPLRRITMTIDEFSTQSVRAPGNYPYHFMFVSQVDGDWIDLLPSKYNDPKFEFAKPITQLNTLTLNFGSPFELIDFDPDRSQSTIVGFGNPTTIRTIIDHKLQSGNYVYFSNFTTLNPVQDVKVIDRFNNPPKNGYPVIVTTPNEFTVPIDTSSLQTALSGTSAITTGTTLVTGIGTSYTTELKVGDTIRLTDGVNFYYPVVASITDNFNLNVVSYSGPTIGPIIIYRVTYTDTQFLTYFDSKRIIVQFELTYINPDIFG